MLKFGHTKDLPLVGQDRRSVAIILEPLQQFRHTRVQPAFLPNGGVVEPHVGVLNLLLAAGEEPGQVLQEGTGILSAQVGGDGPRITQRVGGLIHQAQVDVPTVPQGQVPVENHRL